MVFGIRSSCLAVATAYLALLASSSLARAEDLCSIAPSSYTQAKTDHPEFSKALEALEQHAIASWFTDRMTSDERSTMISSMLKQCSEDTRLSIVVYGIPNKDCDAGLSSGGSVKSTDDYKTFLKELTGAVGDRKVLYVVEPDALGLLAKDGSCGSSAGYLDNLKVAVEALSANANAELYVDVGYWMLADSSNAAKIAPIMQELSTCGKVKGVTINTSNYRSNDECATYCNNFRTAMGKSDMTCIVDTSRNYNGSPTSDWCNIPTAGIGKPPTSETGISNLDYFMWIKPPGESDGQCNGGTAAGSFYPEGFTKLWDLGYFVKEGGMKTIAGGTGDVSQSSNQTSAQASQTSSQTGDQTSQTSSQTGTQTSVQTEAPTASSNVDQTSSIGQDYDGSAAVGTVAPADTSSSESSTTPAAPTSAGASQTSPPTTAPATTPSAPASTPAAASTGCKAKLRRRKL